MALQCCICLEAFASPDVMGVMDCGHTGCGACLTRWLKKNRTCHTCRQPARSWRPLYLNFAGPATPPRARRPVTSTSNASVETVVALEVLDNLGPAASAAEVDRAQELVLRAATTSDGADANATWLREALDDLKNRVAPQFETCRRELHEKREHTTKLEQKYSLAKRLRRELEERQIQFAEAAESALEQKAHSDRRRAAAERERDDAIVRAVAAVHECEAVKKDLEKIPSMETLRKEVHTYKALADHHSRERKKYKVLWKKLDEENRDLRSQVASLSGPAPVPETPSEPDCTSFDTTKDDTSVTMVALSDNEDETFTSAPDAKRKRLDLELLDDPAAGPRHSSGRSLFGSTHPLPPQLTASAKRNVRKPDGTAFPIKLDAQGRLQQSAVFGQKNKKRVR